MLYSLHFLQHKTDETTAFCNNPPPEEEGRDQFLGDSSRLPRIDSVKAIILNSIYTVVSVCLSVCSVTDSRQRISLDREHNVIMLL